MIGHNITSVPCLDPHSAIDSSHLSRQSTTPSHFADLWMHWGEPCPHLTYSTSVTRVLKKWQVTEIMNYWGYMFTVSARFGSEAGALDFVLTIRTVFNSVAEEGRIEKAVRRRLSNDVINRCDWTRVHEEKWRKTGGISWANLKKWINFN